MKCVVGGELREAASVRSLVLRRPEDQDYINNFFFLPKESTLARREGVLPGRAQAP